MGWDVERRGRDGRSPRFGRRWSETYGYWWRLVYGRERSVPLQMPSSSQVFQAAYQLPHCQPPLATMITPTFVPPCISPPLHPASLSATQTTGSSVTEAQ